MKRNAFGKLDGNLLLGIAGPGLDWQIDMATFLANKLLPKVIQNSVIFSIIDIRPGI